MKLNVAGFAWGVFLFWASAALSSETNTPASLAGRAEQIAQAAEALRPKLIETRRDFHQHPELSNREERTARVVAERLRALGFDEVKTNVARHGVGALLKGAKSGPAGAVRADMGAVPINASM